MKKFGLGCFHFKAKEFISFEEYTKFLKEDLDKITNISNLKIINTEDGWSSGFLPIDEENIEKFNFDDSTGFYPSFYRGNISFDIFIPKKAQNKVFDENISYKNNENFKVEIYFNHIFTFTIIEPKNIQNYEEGSLSIILVREFLKNELNNSKDIRFELEVLGPSPFHSDFEIELLNNSELNNRYKNISNTKIHIEIVPRDSYDLIKINGAKENFKNEIEFKNFVMQKLSEEFALLYLQTLGDNYKSQLWDKVDNSLAMAKSNYSKKWWQFKYPMTSKIEKLFVELVNFKHHNISFSKQINEHVNRIKREKGIFYLIEFIENNDILVSEKSIENVSDLVNFMDKKQSNYINNLYFVITTIIATALGVILGFFLKK